MGILSHKERFIKIEKPFTTAGFYALTEQPFTIGKLVKLKGEDNIDDFKARKATLNYYIGRVPGFNIFFIHSGFEHPPDHIVSDAEIKANIDEMCNWFLHNKIPGNKDTIKKYKIKTK